MSEASRVIAMAGSAGGIEALITVLSGLPLHFPAAVLVAQHLPPAAKHISQLCQVLSRSTLLTVKWAVCGEPVKAGNVYLTPQDRLMTMTATGCVCLTAAPRTNRFRPIADPLFTSVAQQYGPHAMAVILSGILWDGAAGAKSIAEAGGCVLVQDRQTSAYFDMPQAACDTGVVHSVLPVAAIPKTLKTILEGEPPLLGHSLTGRPFYSYRSARIGSTCAARRAGTYPANIATSETTLTAAAADSGSLG